MQVFILIQKNLSDDYIIKKASSQRVQMNNCNIYSHSQQEEFIPLNPGLLTSR